MRTGLHTLIIDGNYFAMSRLFVLPRGGKNSIFMDTDEEVEMFINKLSMDFAYEFRKLSSVTDKIAFALDSNSWRKDFYDTYKATRKQNDDVNWGNVFGALKSFGEILESHGVIVNRVEGAEGDDLLFAWSTYLNSIGKNALLWTGDRDLLQLVNYNKSSNSYTLVHDSYRKMLYTYPGFDRWIKTKEEADIFNQGILQEDIVKSSLDEIIVKNKLTLEPIFCDEYVFKKILTGDSSDNIASVVQTVKTLKNGKQRTYKITDKKATEILLEFKKKHKRMSIVYLFDEAHLMSVSEIIKRHTKTKDSVDDIKNRLLDNTNMILLHTKTIPQPIFDAMLDTVEDTFDKANLDRNVVSSKESILENTKYFSNLNAGSRRRKPKSVTEKLF